MEEPEKDELWKAVNLAFKIKDWERSVLFLTYFINTYQDEDLMKAYQQRGWAYYKLERYDESISDLEYAIELEPYCKENYFFLGNTYLNKQDFPNAIRNYREALNLDPNHLGAIANLGTVLWRYNINPEEGECLLLKAKRMQPYNQAIKENMKNLYAKNKRIWEFCNIIIEQDACIYALESRN
ncbi:hypothetical protein AYK26_06205 [Euryarchaeota archaeon SM23-78]|nr:MAG: hypothetical protein AYK26_06205 [Euryarchaeota archaeon SM23-78]MBW3001219.1 tetratricopeptide repeat protein [Candidatus Woesearchaeota archaeon]